MGIPAHPFVMGRESQAGRLTRMAGEPAGGSCRPNDRHRRALPAPPCERAIACGKDQTESDDRATVFSCLTVEVSEQELRWHFGPRLWSYRLPLDQIETFAIVRNRPGPKATAALSAAGYAARQAGLNRSCG
jgi:hypothetical protein